MLNKIWICLLIVGLFSFVPVITFAEGMSKEQGNAILKELKQIRSLLQQQYRAGPVQKKAFVPSKVELSAKVGKTIGSKKARLVLVEFTDYQCPYCKRFFDSTFSDLKKKYIDTGKMKFISRNLPLAFHSHARNAAMASLCAGDQNKYWTMRDRLFANTGKLDESSLKDHAKSIGLKMKKFNSCFDSKKHAKKIDADMKDAQRVGITGTPSFVLGVIKGDKIIGERIVGARPISYFEQEIDKRLKK